jgi:teichuronic acid exporter
MTVATEKSEENAAPAGKSLKGRTIKALKWSMVQEIAQRGLQFAIGIVLARLLSPAEFGLLAMLTIFIAVSQALLDSGFGSALIQRKEPTLSDECSVFYFNLLSGLALAGLLCLAAPWIAVFYNQPQLTSLVRALSVVLVINSFSVVQNALMVRRLDFRSQAMVAVASMSFSGGLAMFMAWRGFGVWSLVVQQITAATIRTLMLWVVNKWRPRMIFSFQSLRELFRFGSSMMASSVVSRVFDNLTSLVIGKVFAPSVLGFYSRAFSLHEIASQSLASVANRVTFPVFSQIQDDPVRLKRALQNGMTMLVFLQFPLLIGLAAVAEPLVLVLLTEKWAPCIPYLQVLCLAGLLYPVHLLNLNILMAMGHSKLFFKLEIIKKIMLAANILITFRWGVLAMVWGMVVVSVAGYFLNACYAKRLIKYSIPEQLRDLLPYFGASAVMGLTVYLVNLPAAAGTAVQLIFKIVLGMAVYGCSTRLLGLTGLAKLSEAFRGRNPVAASIA